MNTFIMMWNPGISNWTMKNLEKTIRHFDDVVYNWAIFDYKKAKVGDRFFMVRCGEGNTGIVMSGYLTSKARKGEDWSGKGREVYYVDLELESIIHPDNEEIITTKELEKNIPDFDWNGGHSGRLLDKMSAGKLELMWRAFVNGHLDMFSKGEAEYNDWMEYDADDIINTYFKKEFGETCECCSFNYKKVHGRQCKGAIDYVRLDTTDYDDAEKLKASYHALCPNCHRIIKTEEDLERLKADEETIEICGGKIIIEPNIENTIK